MAGSVGHRRLAFAWVAAAILLVGVVAGVYVFTRSNGPVPRPPGESGSGAYVSGTVLDTRGVPIQAAEVLRGASLLGRSGNDGHFLVPLEPGTHTIMVRAAGFLPAFETVRLVAGQTSRVHIWIAPLSPTRSVEAESGGALNDQDGRLVIRPDSLVYTDTGEEVRGSVEVAFDFFNRTDPSNLDVFPGEFRGVDPDGDLAPIETFGFAFMEASQGGREVQPKPGSTARLEFPVPPEFDRAADRLPQLWSFDEVDGRWIPVSNVTLECAGASCIFVGEVTHFSIWNCDKLLQAVVTVGKVLLSTVGKDVLIDWVIRVIAPEMAVARFFIELAIDLAIQYATSGQTLTPQQVAETFMQAAAEEFLSFMGVELGGQDIVDTILEGINEAGHLQEIFETMGQEFGKSVTQVHESGAQTNEAVADLLSRGIERAWSAFPDPPPGVGVNPDGAHDAARGMVPKILPQIPNYVPTPPGQPVTPAHAAALEGAVSAQFFHLVYTSYYPDVPYGLLVLNSTEDILLVLQRMVSAFLFDSPPGQVRTLQVGEGEPRGIFGTASRGSIGTRAFGYELEDPVGEDGAFHLLAQKDSNVRFLVRAPGYAPEDEEIVTPDRNVVFEDSPSRYFRLRPFVLFRSNQSETLLVNTGPMGRAYAVPPEFPGGAKLMQDLREWERLGAPSDLFNPSALEESVAADQRRLKDWLYERSMSRVDYFRIDAVKAALQNTIAVLHSTGYATDLLVFGNENPTVLETASRNYESLQDRVYFLDTAAAGDLWTQLNWTLWNIGSDSVRLVTGGPGRLDGDRGRLLDFSNESNPVRLAREFGVRICITAVGLPETMDAELYRAIARETGCSYSFAPDVRALTFDLARPLLEEQWDRPVLEAVDAEPGMGPITIDVGDDAPRLVVYGTSHRNQIDDLSVKGPGGQEAPIAIQRTLLKAVVVEDPAPGPWQAKPYGPEKYSIIMIAGPRLILRN